MKLRNIKGVDPVQRVAPKDRGHDDSRAAARRDLQDRAMPAAPTAGESPGEARSAVMRLMAEVDRLKAELESTHLRMRALQAEADEDPLVPVLNRRGFMRELGRALAFARRYGTRLSLVYFDINDFKRINDMHGHAAGDAVLAGVTRTLVANVRESDIVGRLGGDEFAAILWSADGNAADAKARQLEDALAGQHHEIGPDVAIAVNVAAGAVELSGREDPVDALARADSVMYARKALIKGRLRA